MANVYTYLVNHSKPKIYTGKISFIIHYYSPTGVGSFGGHYQGALQEC